MQIRKEKKFTESFQEINKLNLKNVTCIAVTSDKIKETIKAIEICQSFCDFHDCFIFTHEKINFKHKIIEPITQKTNYDNFIVKHLPFHIESDFCLTIHWDGFIVNPKAWNNEFFNYDYIGSPWPQHGGICGNGGFCLKSRKFLKTQKNLVKNIQVTQPDDVILCIRLRNWFEYYGCKYAPKDIAYKFASEEGNYDDHNSFGFHDLNLNPQFKNLIYD